MTPETLNLTRTDIEAVADYVFTHSRGSQNGRAYKVWVKMFKFLGGEIEEEKDPTDQQELF